MLSGYNGGILSLRSHWELTHCWAIEEESRQKKKPNTVSGKGDFSSINFEKQQGIEQKMYLGEEVTLSCVFLCKNKAGIYEPLQGIVL